MRPVLHGSRGIVITFVLAVLSSWAAESPKLQPLPPVLRTLSDAADALSVRQGRALSDLLYRVELKTDAKIVVLILPTVAPETVEDYAQRLLKYWRSNGGISDDQRFVFIVIAKNDRAMRILPSRRLAWVLKPLGKSEAMQHARQFLADNEYYRALITITEKLSQLLSEHGT